MFKSLEKVNHTSDSLKFCHSNLLVPLAISSRDLPQVKVVYQGWTLSSAQIMFLTFGSKDDSRNNKD
jgi:hypothetical protein